MNYCQKKPIKEYFLQGSSYQKNLIYLELRDNIKLGERTLNPNQVVSRSFFFSFTATGRYLVIAGNVTFSFFPIFLFFFQNFDLFSQF